MKSKRVELKLQNLLDNFKNYGYVNQSELVEDALRFFKRMKSQDLRRQWRLEAFEELRQVKPNCVFEKIDGEDFISSAV